MLGMITVSSARATAFAPLAKVADIAYAVMAMVLMSDIIKSPLSGARNVTAAEYVQIIAKTDIVQNVPEQAKK